MAHELEKKIRDSQIRLSEHLQKLWRESEQLNDVIEKYRVSEENLKTVAGGAGGREPVHAIGDPVRFRAHPDEGGIGEVIDVIDVGDNYIVIVYFPDLQKTFNGYQGAFIKA